MNLTNDDVQEILRLLDDTAYDELHLSTGQFTLAFKRTGQGQDGWTQATRTLATANITPLRDSEAPVKVQDTTEPAGTGPAPDGLEDIRSPMVGIFYRAPKPGAAPFVDVGAQVTGYTVIAIIEVMKLMNSISTGIKGEIVEILAQDAQFVEKGQLLMRMRPAAP